MTRNHGASNQKKRKKKRKINNIPTKLAHYKIKNNNISLTNFKL